MNSVKNYEVLVEMPFVLMFDVGKAINEYKKLQDTTKSSSDDKINCFKKLMEIQENIKNTNDIVFFNEYKKEYELCEKIMKM
jgi:hypothetical protein